MATDLTKKYYKIKDAAEIVGVSQSTIRYWEKEFSDINPVRSQHNQRYFSPDDIQTLHIIKFLVKERGMKLEVAKEYLKSNKNNISRRVEVIQKLTEVREELKLMLKSLNLRAKPIGIEPEYPE